MADFSLRADSACDNPSIPEVIYHARELQIRLGRIAALAAIIEREADDLPHDCGRNGFYALAEAIRESADVSTDEAERIEIMCNGIERAQRGEA